LDDVPKVEIVRFCPDPVNAAQLSPKVSKMPPYLRLKPIATLPVLHAKSSVDADVVPITVPTYDLDPPLGKVPHRSRAPDVYPFAVL
jgi:hypothetical protein